MSLTVINSYAQPDPPGGHGHNGNQIPGGGAPIGTGTMILIALSFVYASSKILYKDASQETCST